jgi:plastocyanin
MSRPAIVLALCAALVAGCGGDDGGGGAKARAETVPAGKALHEVAREYSFDPKDVVMERPGTVRIVLDNKGSLAHNLKVLKDGEELGGTPTFQGGKPRAGTVRLRPGTYEMVCTVGDHEQLGMKAKLTVK